MSDAVNAMTRIESSSSEIAKIIKVIEDIAFQTNLLALNAGVEAARAGDAGRGFAVVASEVRALAQRASDAASEINGLITSSGQEVEAGVSLVQKTGEALEEIVNSVANVSEHVTAIAQSAAEQSMGLNEINAAMSSLDKATQENVAMVEETTAASHSLSQQAEVLGQATSRFKSEGGAAQTEPWPGRPFSLIAQSYCRSSLALHSRLQHTKSGFLHCRVMRGQSLALAHKQK